MLTSSDGGIARVNKFLPSSLMSCPWVSDFWRSIPLSARLFPNRMHWPTPAITSVLSHFLQDQGLYSPVYMCWDLLDYHSGGNGIVRRCREREVLSCKSPATKNKEFLSFQKKAVSHNSVSSGKSTVQVSHARLYMWPQSRYQGSTVLLAGSWIWY